MSGIRFSLDLPAHVVNALHWLKHDLEVTLQQARQALERCEEGDTGALPQALRLTREAAAVLDVARVHGAALLAHEVAATLAAVGGSISPAAPDAETAMSAAMSGLLGLTDYLDRLAAGQPDYAPQLAEAIGELRLAQGLARLSGAELFARHVEALRPEIALPDPGSRQPGMARAIAAKLVGPFQTLLLAWLRGTGGDEALVKMGRVASQLSAQATTLPVYLAWSVFGVVAESLVGVILDEPLEYRRLFGRMGQQLRWLAEQGEEGPDGAAARTGDVAWVLLYHLGRVAGRSARAAALMDSLEIDLRPADDTGMARLRAPGTRLLKSVLAELQSELARVKDVIDLGVRTGNVTAADRLEIHTRLEAVGQILLVLGLPHWQQLLAGQLARLPGVDAAAGPAPWMETATLILRLEYGLAEELHRPPGMAFAETGPEAPPLATPDRHEGQDLLSGRQALAREAMVNLARVKDAIEGWLRRGDDAGLRRVEDLIGTAAAALGVGGEEHGARSLHELASHCRTPILESLLPEAAETDRLADAIAATESYLDALGERVPRRALALGQLDATLARLDGIDGRALGGRGRRHADPDLRPHPQPRGRQFLAEPRCHLRHWPATPGGGDPGQRWPGVGGARSLPGGAGSAGRRGRGGRGIPRSLSRGSRRSAGRAGTHRASLARRPRRTGAAGRCPPGVPYPQGFGAHGRGDRYRGLRTGARDHAQTAASKGRWTWASRCSTSPSAPSAGCRS